MEDSGKTRDIESAADAMSRFEAAAIREDVEEALPKRRLSFKEMASPSLDNIDFDIIMRRLTIPRDRREPMQVLRDGLDAARRHLRPPLGAAAAGEGEVGRAKTASGSSGGAELELKLELLHRYNILSLRSRLLRLLQEEMELTDTGTVDHVNRELDRYSTTIRNYRAFRDEDRYLFAPNEGFDQIVLDMVELDDLKLQGGAAQQIETLRTKIDQAFVGAVRSTTSGLTAKRKADAKKALVSRLFMALGGGLALIGPMLVMILHPTRLTTILTTSCCVVAVGVCLAVFMVDSHPKDVLGCTAAYAAVLVVFVGAGGGAG